MNSGTLTLSGVAPSRSFAHNRYVTKGLPKQGGIAHVYRALDIQSESPVAIKVFRNSGEPDGVVEESFRRETQALSDLRHPHIVRILDSGIEAATADYYIVMEWIDSDLSQLKGRPTSWSTFYDSVGRKVLEAIAFAHTRATAHRDVKPSNVLISPDGTPKICDFGISKIRNFLEPGVTLSHYASMPYAPPEYDDGSHTYSRDVFGFAALAVDVLSPTKISDHKSLLLALESLLIDADVKRILSRCLNLQHPEERPENAVVLLGELDKAKPTIDNLEKDIIPILSTHKVAEIVRYDLGVDDEASLCSFLEADLEDSSVVRQQRDAKLPDNFDEQRAFRVIGSRYAYIAVDTGAGQLRLVSALELLPSELERARSRALLSPYRYCFQVTDPQTSMRRIDAMCDELARFNADQKLVQLQEREQAIYRTWLDLLSAKTELERQRRRRVKYGRYDAGTSTIRFYLAGPVPLAYLDGQDVKIETEGGNAFLGEVVSVSTESVVVHANERNRVPVSLLPDSGYLDVDTTKSDAAIDKQRSAVDAVRYGRSVNPLLGGFVVSPDSVPPVVPSDVTFIQPEIDDDKKLAVRVAMARPELMVVQGPPGTGKTTFITELVLQTLRETPAAKILLTSQTHLALDNSLERIEKQGRGKVRAVRVGNENDERIAESTRPLLIDNRLPVLRKEALASGRTFIERWAQERGVGLNETRMAMALEVRAGLRERLSILVARIAELQPILGEERRLTLTASERAELDENLTASIGERDGLTRQLKENLDEIKLYERDTETLKLLSDCTPKELRAWADDYAPHSTEGASLRRLLAAHATWEARFGRNYEFRAALIATSQVVAGTCLGIMGIPGRKDITYDLCIVDEASIATPTEVLVPMSRARRTILVGDQKQLSPFQDPELKTSGLLKRFDLSVEDQKATLFNVLTASLHPDLRLKLTNQHRMVPPIGKLISSCFYANELHSAERPVRDFLLPVFPRPVTWFTTSGSLGKASKPLGTTHYNNLEINFVVRLLTRIDFSIRHGKVKGRKVSVAVLTGYGEQRLRLRSAIDLIQHEWVSFSDVYVNVVDAFQGREADIAIFSVTRSEGDTLGFLRDMERINVALSRAKDLLAIVGDQAFCEAVDDPANPLRDVLKYIRGNPDDCALVEAA